MTYLKSGKKPFVPPLPKSEQRFDKTPDVLDGHLQEKNGAWFFMLEMDRAELAYPITLAADFTMPLKSREHAKIKVAPIIRGDRTGEHEIFVQRFDRTFCIGMASNRASFRQWRFK